MIEKIIVKDVASYDEKGIDINLNRINYIYGSNGSGKTTISEMLRNNANSKFSSCNIEWKHGYSNLDIFVYNRHFVEENFSVRKEIQGIFTLGKESTDILELIDQQKKEIEKHRERISRIDINIAKRKDQISEIQTNFMNQCWDLKSKYDNSFEEAFSGLRSSKKKFMERCLDEAENNNGELNTYEKLKKRVESVFKNLGEKVEIIPQIHFEKSKEEDPIFQEKIIGKNDIDIAKLITELNISDWVQHGHKHMENTDGICPFCQQTLPDGFKEKLEDYFDETYKTQIQNLSNSINRYESEIKGLLEKYNFFVANNISFIDSEKIKSLFQIINSTYRENIQLLEQKKNEPSRTVSLSLIREYVDQINSEIDKANLQISQLNSVIDNIEIEKERLIKDIWKFVIEENKINYESYKRSINREERALEGLKRSKNTQKGYKKKLEDDVVELQKQLISVLPSINEINNLLKSFGFTNFHLAESDEQGNYKIVRQNGEDANETLSEGEKTFITFLYFYQLINGSSEQEKVNTPRIIVIDDPISSLDSHVLFMVSNLVNKLKAKIRSNDSNFKQLIILTHNVYFHKEISFNKGMAPEKQPDESFWIIRKTNNVSNIYEYQENPIKNSYELLWKELKENLNSVTTPNIMRRILENYFKFFGNIDVNKIIDSFPDEEKVVCNTLLSWANDGSHHMNDDLFVDSSPDTNMRYLDIFKRIFVNSGHESHFTMMFGEGIEEIAVNENSINQKAQKEIQEAMAQVASEKE